MVFTTPERDEARLTQATDSDVRLGLFVGGCAFVQLRGLVKKVFFFFPFHILRLNFHFLSCYVGIVGGKEVGSCEPQEMQMFRLIFL